MSRSFMPIFKQASLKCGFMTLVSFTTAPNAITSVLNTGETQIKNLVLSVKSFVSRMKLEVERIGD